MNFWCPRFTDGRKELEDGLGSTREPETLVELMLTTKKKWSKISSFATTVMKRLREEEHERRGDQQQRIPVRSKEKSENAEELNS